jgi:hypothetical protein
MPKTLIITGMHRSGTSLMASLIQALGIHIGSRLYEADQFNIKGYFEDVDFLEFQRQMLQACYPAGESGWPDWGWSESETLYREQFQNYQRSAQNLIESRASFSIWGWKDPRTSLLLDFWHQLLSDPSYILVYRFPWDVADSILRLKAGIFSAYPDYPLKIWAYYNRHLLDFYRRYPQHCILVNINTLLQSPEKLIDLLKTKLNLQTSMESSTHLPQIYQSNLFQTIDFNQPIVQLLQKTSPQSFEILSQLDQLADIPSHFCTNDFDFNTTALESLPLLLYRQIQDREEQLCRQSQQLQQENQQLYLQLQQMQQENLALKQSKVWKLYQLISRFKRVTTK